MLTMPRYINALDIRGKIIEAEISQPKINVLIDADLPVVELATFRATERAKIGYAAAVAEWIAWRLEGVSDVTDLLHFAEAMWVANVDYRYAHEIPHVVPENTQGGEYVAYRAWQKLN